MTTYAGIIVSIVLLLMLVVVFYNRLQLIYKLKQQISRQKEMETSHQRQLEHEAELCRQQITNLKTQFEECKQQASNQQEELKLLRQENVKLQTEQEDLKQFFSEKEKTLQQSREQMLKDFEALASKALHNNNMAFNQSTSKNLQDILSPLREKIEKFESKVEQTYEKGLKDQTDLRAELKKLHDLNQSLNAEAAKLSKTLRADTRQQGSWGEFILEKILEKSGLVKGREYFTQESIRDDSGQLLRPDVTIKLPEDKHLIVDSKVSLVAFDHYVNSDETSARDGFLRQHIDSVRSHIKSLSDKHYSSAAVLRSPDFVLLFMPIEPAFITAMQYAPDLFAYGWDRKVILVGPSTLLASLRTVETIWQHERQTQNALQIALEGGKLYDKFVGFLEDLDKMGRQITQLQNSYGDARNKLQSGRGNLISKVEQLRIMGAKVGKQLPQSFEYEE